MMKKINDVLLKIRTLIPDTAHREIRKLFAVMLASACLEVFGVSMIVPFMTILIQPDAANGSGLSGILGQIVHSNDSAAFTVFCIVCLVAIYVVKTIVMICSAKMRGRFVTGMKADLRRKLFEHYLSRSYAYFLEKNSGELHHELIIDVDKSCEIVNQLLSLTTEGIITVFLTVAIFIIHPLMTACITLVLILISLFIIRVLRPKMNASGREVVFYGKLRNKWIMQGLTGIKEVKHLNAEDFVAELESEAEKKVADGECRRFVGTSLPKALIEAGIIISVLILIAVMSLRGAEPASLIPQISALAMAALKLLPGVSRITSGITVITYNKPSLDTVVKAMEETDNETAHQTTDVQSDPSSAEVIGLEHVSFKYGSESRMILDDVSLSVKRGSMIGIMGESGSGKTTLADIIMGLLNADSGVVRTDPERIGYVTQSVFMLDDTIRNNVAFGIRSDAVSDDQIRECLEEAQLADFVNGLPEGLDTQIGERGMRISGGQQQRIGIARALYKDPEVLLFDEATSALDIKSENAIIESVNHLHGRKTIIIIAHKSGILSGCDIIYRVQNGKIIADRECPAV